MISEIAVTDGFHGRRGQVGALMPWPSPSPVSGLRSDPTAVWSQCRRRIRRWRVPYQWSAREWMEEVEAEASAAAVQAACDFDGTRGVPWDAFLRRRVMEAVLARYRREWSYSRRRAVLPVGDLDRPDDPEATALGERDFTALLGALRQLSAEDHQIIDRLYWRGETERQLAEEFGLTQQAVNKRKQTILLALRKILLALENEHWRL